MWRNISVWHIVVLVLALVLLFGWRRLPDMARSVGQSLRVFKTEVDQMGKDKDRRDGVPRESDPTVAAPTTTPVPDPHAPEAPRAPVQGGSADADAVRPGVDDDVSPPAGTSSEQHRP